MATCPKCKKRDLRPGEDLCPYCKNKETNLWVKAGEGMVVVAGAIYTVAKLFLGGKNT